MGTNGNGGNGEMVKKIIFWGATTGITALISWLVFLTVQLSYVKSELAKRPTYSEMEKYPTRSEVQSMIAEAGFVTRQEAIEIAKTHAPYVQDREFIRSNLTEALSGSREMGKAVASMSENLNRRLGELQVSIARLEVVIEGLKKEQKQE